MMKTHKNTHPGIVYNHFGSSVQHKQARKIIVPVCANCKRIRIPDGDPNDQKSWIYPDFKIDNPDFIALSHGICPNCMKDLYTDYLQAS